MITVENLTRTYGPFRAVDDVSFVCQPGKVTGFLGPNGAGKSTTMRVMTGLTPPTAGQALIGGVRYEDIPNPGTQVGVLLDASAQHAGRTGRDRQGGAGGWLRLWLPEQPMSLHVGELTSEVVATGEAKPAAPGEVSVWEERHRVQAILARVDRDRARTAADGRHD